MAEDLWATMWQGTQQMGPVIRRALAHQVVVDTWMNGEVEEAVVFDADALLDASATQWAQEALRAHAIFPTYPMPAPYVESVFADLLTGTALYAAQQRTGRRTVTLADARTAVDRVAAWLAAEPDGWTTAGRYHGVRSSGSMKT